MKWQGVRNLKQEALSITLWGVAIVIGGSILYYIGGRNQ